MLSWWGCSCSWWWWELFKYSRGVVQKSVSSTRCCTRKERKVAELNCLSSERIMYGVVCTSNWWWSRSSKGRKRRKAKWGRNLRASSLCRRVVPCANIFFHISSHFLSLASLVSVRERNAWASELPFTLEITYITEACLSVPLNLLVA